MSPELIDSGGGGGVCVFERVFVSNVNGWLDNIDGQWECLCVVLECVQVSLFSSLYLWSKGQEITLT